METEEKAMPEGKEREKTRNMNIDETIEVIRNTDFPDNMDEVIQVLQGILQQEQYEIPVAMMEAYLYGLIEGRKETNR